MRNSIKLASVLALLISATPGAPEAYAEDSAVRFKFEIDCRCRLTVPNTLHFIGDVAVCGKDFKFDEEKVLLKGVYFYESKGDGHCQIELRGLTSEQLKLLKSQSRVGSLAIRSGDRGW